MNHPLLYLVTRSFWNTLVFRARRLRQPKYLFGSFFGAAYFFLCFGRVFLLRSQPSLRHGMPDLLATSTGPQIGALLLFAVMLVFSWILSGSRAALLFTEAEVAWLFSAPLSRPTLIRYKLFKAQFGLLFTSLIFAFVSGRAFLGGAIWPKILGWWVILATLQLHRMGASFALQRLREHGLADGKRRAAFAVGVIAVAATVYFAGKDAAQIRSFDEFAAQAPRLLNSQMARGILWPFRLVVTPWFMATPAGFLRALVPAAGIIVLHYFWVVRADVSFEEASIALSQRRAAFVAARQRGERSIRKAPTESRQAVFRLRSTGPIAVAFLWKSFLQLGGRKTLRIIGGSLIAALAVSRVTTSLQHPPVVNALILAFGAGVFVLAVLGTPSQAAIQFRRGVESMDLLKGYPVSGWQAVAGELAAPLFCGLAVQIGAALFLLINVTVLTQALDVKFPSAAISCIFAGLAILPGLNLVSTFLPCACTLLFPAWFKTGKPGMEASGLRLLLILGQLIAFMAALVPAAALALIGWFLLIPIMTAFHTFSVVALAAGAVLFIEGMLGLTILGRLFDEFDVSEDAQ